MDQFDLSQSSAIPAPISGGTKLDKLPFLKGNYRIDQSPALAKWTDRRSFVWKCLTKPQRRFWGDPSSNSNPKGRIIDVNQF